MNIGTKKHLGPIIVVVVIQMALILLVHSVMADNGLPDKRQASKGHEVGEAAGLANCRYGVAALGNSQVDWVDDLNAGWYLNFGPSAAAASNSAEYTPVIGIRQKKDSNGNYLPTYTVTPAVSESGLGALVDSKPNSLWIVGNEVDRGPNPGQTQGGQGDTFPNIYAKAYHEVYTYIKQRDPSAQVANSALVQVTPGRLKYLDLMWAAYKAEYGTAMPVDVWNMHLYILPEVNPSGQPNGIANVALGTSPSLGRKESGGNASLCPLVEVYCIAEHDDINVFNDQVVAMRSWMNDHGQRNKPLILSEFSLLYPYIDDGGTCWQSDEFGNCFTPQRVTNYLNSSFNYLKNATDPNLGYPNDGNRLIQQALWFSINNEGAVGDVSDLMRNNTLTQVGQAFKSFVAAQPVNVNLFFDGTNNPTGTTGGGGTANVALTAKVRNNGSIAPTGNFFVTFYKDAGLTQPIGTALIAGPSPTTAGMTGCGRLVRTVSVTWNNLSPGIHRYWVKVDSTNAVVEVTEGDNIGAGIVIINANQNFVPLVRR